MAASRKRSSPRAPAPARAAARQRGAALLLMLALAGVGAASLLISALSHNRQELRRTQQTMASLALARDALVGFAVTYGRLPRPAISATDGREAPLPCASEEACTGLLPWVTLGVEPSDAWGKLLRYSVTPAYTQAPLQRLSAVATKTVQTRYPDGQLMFLAGQSVCELAAQCVPFVLLSHGQYNFGFSRLGIPQVNTAGANGDEQLNALGSQHFVARPASDDPQAPGGPFDDLVVFVPVQYLYQQMAKAHRLP